MTALKLCLAVIILGLSFSAGADSLKGGYLICVTEDLLKQGIRALIGKDKFAWQYLIKNGCGLTKSGIHITVLDVKVWLGPGKVRYWPTKIRLYSEENRTIEMWTSMENIEIDKK